jgi:hypothetical protein
VSMILNEHREPAGAADRFMDAVHRLIKKRESE